MFEQYSATAMFSIYLDRFTIYGANYGNISRTLFLAEYGSSTFKIKKSRMDFRITDQISKAKITEEEISK
jgi:hypothetical protein